MATKKSSDKFAKFKRAVSLRQEYDGWALTCHSHPEGTKRGAYKGVPTGSTYVVQSYGAPIAWVDKDGGLNFTTRKSHPDNRDQWYSTVCTDQTWRRHIKAAKDSLVDTAVLEQEEQEAIASIMALFQDAELVEA